MAHLRDDKPRLTEKVDPEARKNARTKRTENTAYPTRNEVSRVKHIKTEIMPSRVLSALIAVLIAAAVVFAAVSCSKGEPEEGYETMEFDVTNGENAATGSGTESDTGTAEVTTEDVTTEESTEEESTEDVTDTDTEDEETSADARTDKGRIFDTGFTLSDDPRWDKAIDGMILETVTGATFKGYVLLIRDPSRVSVAISDRSFSTGKRIFQVVEQYGAIAAINGGEFPDDGNGPGNEPVGLTYSHGECVWNDGHQNTFMGFTQNGRLIVEEGTTRASADAYGIRDGVSFQHGNTLISQSGGSVRYHYSDSTYGVAQRTAIGQLADGTVIIVVTDGRCAASLGATRNEIIDILKSYGAVSAGMLDGGASSLLWYTDWSKKYGVDESRLDYWQSQGLVNKFKAFTYPRMMPTFFIVAPDGSGGTAAQTEPTQTDVVVPSGYTVRVGGVTLDDRFVTERFVFPDAAQLPDGVSGTSYVRYAVAGAPSSHSITVFDKDGAAVDAVYNDVEKAYRVYPPSDAALEAEFADYAISAMSDFALLMSADRSWEGVAHWFDPSGIAYSRTSQAAQFTWTVFAHNSATIHDAEASRFIRYSDSCFSCRVSLTNTLTRNGGTWNDCIDWTVVFRNTGGSWRICGLVYNP